MKLISWNVNGLRAVHKKGLFLPFIEKYKPDILCLQEIKSRKDQNEIDLVNYEEYWNPAEKSGYSGTAIFTNEKALSTAIGFPENIVKKYKLAEDNFGNPNNEGRILTAEFDNFFVINCYTPNSKQDLSRLKLRKNKWDPAFLEYLNYLKNKKSVIFCGDLNVAHTEDDLAHPETNHKNHGFTDGERLGIEKIIDAGFVDTFRIFTKENGHYTWWAQWANARVRNVGWRIDYFFVSKDLEPKVKSAKILADIMGSDHCPILLEIDN